MIAPLDGSSRVSLGMSLNEHALNYLVQALVDRKQGRSRVGNFGFDNEFRHICGKRGDVHGGFKFSSKVCIIYFFTLGLNHDDKKIRPFNNMHQCIGLKERGKYYHHESYNTFKIGQT